MTGSEETLVLAVRESPDEAGPQGRLATFYLSTRRYQEALDAYEGSIALAGGGAGSLLGAGVSLYALGRLADAEQYLKRAATAEPSARAQGEQSETRSERRGGGVPAATIEEARSPWGYFWLGRVYETRPEKEKDKEGTSERLLLSSALRCYVKAARLGDSPVFWVPVARILDSHPELDKEGVTDEARRHSSNLKTKQAAPARGTPPRIEKVLYALLRGEVAEARRAALDQKLARIDPDTLSSPRAATLGSYFAYRKNPVAALTFYRHAGAGADPNVLKEFFQYACYLASHRGDAGDVRGSFKHLIEAKRVASQLGERSATVEGVERAYEAANRKLFLRDFLKHLKGEPLAEGFDVGRLAYLYRVITSDRRSVALRLKLADRKSLETASLWDEILKDHSSDPLFLHSLALLYQEWAEAFEAGGRDEDARRHHRLSIRFWLQASCREDFWSEMRKGSGLSDADFEAYRSGFLERLLKRHLERVEDRLRKHDDPGAKGYYAILTDLSYCAWDSVPACNREGIESAVESLREKWAQKFIQEAQVELDKVEGLPTGISKNYDGALRVLERLLTVDEDCRPALQVAVEKANQWSMELLPTQKKDEIREITAKWAPHAERLMKHLVRGQGQLPENHAFATAQVFRAFFVETESEKRIELVRRGLEYSPEHEDSKYFLSMEENAAGEAPTRASLGQAELLAAAELFDEVIEELQGIPEAFSGIHRVRGLLGVAYAKKGDRFSARGMVEEALAHYDLAARQYEAFPSQYAFMGDVRRELANVYSRKGSVLQSAARAQEAEDCFKKADRIWDGLSKGSR